MGKDDLINTAYQTPDHIWCFNCGMWVTQDHVCDKSTSPLQFKPVDVGSYNFKTFDLGEKILDLESKLDRIIRLLEEIEFNGRRR